MRLIPLEGNRQRLDGGAMFGHVPKEMWSHWIGCDEKNRIPLACRSLLFEQDNGKKILFEAGVGPFFEPKLKERYGIEGHTHLLLENLEKVGVREDEIDAVVLSHLHFDHAGGLLPPFGEKPRLLFPNAKIYVGKTHWERAQNPHPREKGSFIPFLPSLLKESNRLILIDGETHPELPGIRFSTFDGHTIGLMISEIEFRKKSVYFVSDLIPGLAWIHIPVTMGYDRFAELVVDEKQRFLEKAYAQQALLFFTHDPNCACASLHRDEQGRYHGQSKPLSFF